MTEVTPGSVADRAGVKVNDRLLEVNGESIDDATHEQVVDKIKQAGSSVMFLLADEETDRHFKNKRMKIGAWLATTMHLVYTPRIAHMTKGSDGYGFLLKEEPRQTGKAKINMSVHTKYFHQECCGLTVCSNALCRTLHQGHRKRQPSQKGRSEGNGQAGGSGWQRGGWLQP